MPTDTDDLPFTPDDLPTPPDDDVSEPAASIGGNTAEVLDAPTDASLTVFSKTKAALEDLKKRFHGPITHDVKTKAGMTALRAERKQLVSLRTSLERARLDANRDDRERIQKRDSIAKAITADILAYEQPRDELILAEEARLEAERVAKAEAERQRVAEIVEKIGRMKAGVDVFRGKSSDKIASGIEFLTGMAITQDVYAEFYEMALNARDAVIKEMSELHDAALAREAEQAELAALRKAEAERKEKEASEQAERERVAAEARAVAEREFQERQAALAEREAEIKRQREELAALEAAIKARIETPAVSEEVADAEGLDMHGEPPVPEVIATAIEIPAAAFHERTTQEQASDLFNMDDEETIHSPPLTKIVRARDGTVLEVPGDRPTTTREDHDFLKTIAFRMGMTYASLWAELSVCDWPALNPIHWEN